VIILKHCNDKQKLRLFWAYDWFLKLSHNDLSNRDKKNTTTGEKYLANSL